jgi:hypothetical protein
MMSKLQNKQALDKLIEEARTIIIQSSRDQNFKTWRFLCERTLIKIYGENSKELEQFNRLSFYDKHFDRDLNITLKLFSQLISELEDNDIKLENEMKATCSKLFISHSEGDKLIVGEIIDLLEGIGLNPAQIFCSSIDGYGIPLGENFLEVLKKEISKNVLVLFILSHNFYKSPICLCEMGASWVLTKEHIPIIIPPFTFDDIKGVLPKFIQGLPVNDPLKLNLLHEKIATTFCLGEQPMSVWERKRDRVIKRINKIMVK